MKVAVGQQTGGRAGDGNTSSSEKRGLAVLNAALTFEEALPSCGVNA